MAKVISGNYAYQQLPSDVEAGDVFTGNACQAIIDTPICNVPIHCKGANIINVLLPPGSTVEDCCEGKWDYCYWLHKNDGDLGAALPVEVANCRHVVGTPEVIQNDGVTIETIYTRSDKRVA